MTIATCSCGNRLGKSRSKRCRACYLARSRERLDRLAERIAAGDRVRYRRRSNQPLAEGT